MIEKYLDVFNEYIKDYDRRTVYLNLKRGLLYIFTKCIVLTDENMDIGDIVKLNSLDPNVSFYLVLNYKIKQNDPFKGDIYYSYNYSLYCKITDNNTESEFLNGVELLETTCIDIDTVVEIKFKVLPECYDNFTDEQHSLVNYILRNYVRSVDNEEAYDLFHSIIVLDKDDENDS